ncbi:Ser/Thr protein phosphatase [Tritrichomonas foetus]|uniref:Serine/threonine-protein phosphatase n=1 Tax=Tritrichomonas foetus TaxID=1144522 RepID=A0A1J4K3J2_9EUKA|nr:Ser/Thr protein phosphatase [Tritrichomonas foetus]|eukprot:OHT05943.1 Ser/Thr protein phosphatase [Tritrichomonas foetus]
MKIQKIIFCSIQISIDYILKAKKKNLPFIPKSRKMMNSFKPLLDSFMPAIGSNVEQVASQEIRLNIPKIPVDQVVKLCKQVRDIFQKELSMLELRSPCLIVGDIHGHILDLFRILFKCGMPPFRKYIFLGDLVDRGEFSTETVILIFLMKVVYPEHVYIIRGNHEFNCLSQQCGFFSEVIDIYEEPSVYNACINAFSYMPLAARIDNKILCVHGGIGPGFDSLNCIKTILRPLCEYGHSDVINAILWSDPSEEVEEYAPSSRGTGFLFGKKAIDEFIKNCNIELVVRGHECVNDGIEMHFDGHLMTVFSASNYCGLINNQAAVLDIKGEGKYDIKKFPPLEYLHRSDVTFGQKISPPRDGASSSRRLTKGAGIASSHKIVPPITSLPIVSDRIKPCTHRVEETSSYRLMPKLTGEKLPILTPRPYQENNAPRLFQENNAPALIRPPSHRRCKSWY